MSPVTVSYVAFSARPTPWVMVPSASFLSWLIRTRTSLVDSAIALSRPLDLFFGGGSPGWPSAFVPGVAAGFGAGVATGFAPGLPGVAAGFGDSSRRR